MKGRSRSGQMLVVSSFLIAILMISTAVYVYELSGKVEDANDYPLQVFIRAVNIGGKHVAVGALANITNGGQNQTLAEWLASWKSVVEKRCVFGRLTLDYSLLDETPHFSGVRVSWGTDGVGISEAFFEYLMVLDGSDLEMESRGLVNVSSRLYVKDAVVQVLPNASQVTVAWSVFNEGRLALVEAVRLYFYASGEWQTPNESNHYVLSDYGNGTYRATFTLEPLASVDVSVRVQDKRGIVVQANATCVQP